MNRFEPVSSRREIFGQLLWFLAWVFITAVGLFLAPSAQGHGTHQQLGLPPCPSVILWHRPCPGCGLTTAFSALLHGDISGSLAAHPLGLVLYALFTVSALVAIGAYLRRYRWETNNPISNRFLMSIFVVVIAVGLFRFCTVRMVPMPEPLVWSR